METNLLIIHGGGPTAVMNGSLYGVIKEAQKSLKVAKIYGAKNGTGGILKEDFINLTDVSKSVLDTLLTTPGTAIGTSRDPLYDKEYEKIVAVLKKYHIKYVLLNGGNGTMDACGHLYKKCKELGEDIFVIGIPKTMDNDLSVTDHSPGFGSAARYVAQSVKEVCYDVHSLPIHVCVIETLGRNAGWITAASALADENGPYHPDLIYLPERNFDENQFIEDVKKCLEVKKGIVVVVSEGLHDAHGNPIVKPMFKTERATYFGDVSSYLASLVIERLGYKARSEKPGLLGRASIALQSKVDLDEAILVGEEAVRAVLNEESGKMIAMKRQPGTPYQVEIILASIDEVMMVEKKLPESYINESGNGVTKEFIDWCRPLIGSGLPEMTSFNDK